MVTQYGVITTIDSSRAVAVPPTSPIIGGLVGTAVAPVQGANVSAPGTLPEVNTPVFIASLADAYRKGIGLGSLLTAMELIYAQVRANLVVIRTVDITTAPASIPFFSLAGETLGFKANWLAAPGLTIYQRAALPTITFTGGNGSGATAETTEADLNATGGIASVNVTAGGVGYTSAPAVAVTDPDGNGSGAALTAVVSAGSVTGVTVTTAGTDYGTGSIGPVSDPNDVMTALQTEAEHEGVLFVADGLYTSLADFEDWLDNNPRDRSINVPNRVLSGSTPVPASGAVLGAILRNEAENEVGLELPSRHVFRVRTNPSNKVVRGIQGVVPHYSFSDRYQSNAANMLRSANATVITYKEGQWKLWGSDTRTALTPAGAPDPLADISVRRVVEQLEDDLDYEFSFFEDEPQTSALVESVVERGNSVANAYANAGLLDSGTSALDEDTTNLNTGDIGVITEIRVAGVVHRIRNRIHLVLL